MGRSDRPPSAGSIVIGATLLLLVGCTGGPDVTGRLAISGSSTVEPISTRVAELFEDVTPEILVDVDGPGTGDGFQQFCAGEIDIADASRAIKAEELALCEENDVELIELEVAYDGLTVLTSAENEAVECLRLADLYALTGPESNDVDNWRDAAELAGELGSDTTFPDQAFELHAPGQESGTYDAFVDLALKDITAERFEAGHIDAASDDPEAPEAVIREFPGQSDDNVILSGIGGSDSSFGWVGFAFAEGAGDDVREIAIDGGDGCVAPSFESISDGSYPLSRSLYIYVNADTVRSSPALGEYIDFYLSDAGQAAVPEVGYVTLDPETLAATRAIWDARTTGTRDGGE
jgi:phosphate transport system substrate-binding protein